jgi:hypothetical protein
MQHRQDVTVAGLVLVLLSAGGDVSRCLGQGCPPVPIPAGNDLVVPMLSKNGLCQQGSYVQTTLVNFTLDVKAEAWGACDTYVPDGSGGCNYSTTQHRGIAAVDIQDQALGISGGQRVFYNNTLLYKASIYTTSCNLCQIPRPSRSMFLRSSACRSGCDLTVGIMALGSSSAGAHPRRLTPSWTRSSGR